MHTPPALYFLHWKFLTPFISLQHTGQTQISPFITPLMLSLFLSNTQDGLSTIPEFLCSGSFLFLSNAQDGLSTIPEFLCSASFLFPSGSPSVPPQKKEPQKGPKTRSAPVVAYRGDYYEKNCMCNDTDTHHYSVFRNVLSNYPYTTRQI